jgi:uncharacterized LabA/DUF88 family protein
MRRFWLIDAGYMLEASNEVLKRRFDYGRVKSVVESQLGAINEVHFFNSDNGSASTRQFHYNIGKLGFCMHVYTVKTSIKKEMYCKDCGGIVPICCSNDSKHSLSNMQQKGVDVGLATLMLTRLNDYDVLVLSSGDKDLLDAVEYAKSQGKDIELAVFKHGVAQRLINLSSQVLYLEQFKANF